jgi:hypothetical protein
LKWHQLKINYQNFIINITLKQRNKEEVIVIINTIPRKENRDTLIYKKN